MRVEPGRVQNAQLADAQLQLGVPASAARHRAPATGRDKRGGRPLRRASRQRDTSMVRPGSQCDDERGQRQGDRRRDRGQDAAAAAHQRRGPDTHGAACSATRRNLNHPEHRHRLPPRRRNTAQLGMYPRGRDPDSAGLHAPVQGAAPGLERTARLSLDQPQTLELGQAADDACGGPHRRNRSTASSESLQALRPFMRSRWARRLRHPAVNSRSRKPIPRSAAAENRLTTSDEQK